MINNDQANQQHFMQILFLLWKSVWSKFGLFSFVGLLPFFVTVFSVTLGVFGHLFILGMVLLVLFILVFFLFLFTIFLFPITTCNTKDYGFTYSTN